MAETDYERGVKEGRINALLDEHTSRLNKINGSVDRFAKANEKLVAEIRDMKEEARLDRERVKAAAEALEKKTEQERQAVEAARVTRAEELQVPVRVWDLRSNRAQVVYVFIAFVVLVLSFIPHPHL